MKTTTKLLTLVSILGASAASLLAAPTSTNLTVIPTSPVFDSNNVVGVANDAAPGFPESSFASNGAGKTDMYFTPATLFGRAVTLGQIAKISYWTKTGATHDVTPVDWALVIYTNPYAGDVSSASWYGDRIGAEPYLASNLNDPANTWNEWSSNGAQNQFRFFESTAGAPGANFGTYTDPDLAGFLAAPALSGANRSAESILYISLQTGSDVAAGFHGQLDGLRVELTDGSVATVNFEADSDNDGVADGQDECLNSDLRPIVDVNGAEPGNTGIPNTLDPQTGCTIQDLVLDAADTAKNHGQYVSAINQIASKLVAAHRITKAQAQTLQTGAAKSDIGK